MRRDLSQWFLDIRKGCWGNGRRTKVIIHQNHNRKHQEKEKQTIMRYFRVGKKRRNCAVSIIKNCPIHNLSKSTKPHSQRQSQNSTHPMQRKVPHAFRFILAFISSLLMHAHISPGDSLLLLSHLIMYRIVLAFPSFHIQI